MGKHNMDWCTFGWLSTSQALHALGCVVFAIFFVLSFVLFLFFSLSFFSFLSFFHPVFLFNFSFLFSFFLFLFVWDFSFFFWILQFMNWREIKHQDQMLEAGLVHTFKKATQGKLKTIDWYLGSTCYKKYVPSLSR